MVINKVLESLIEENELNDLAYLAATSKIENHIRDKFCIECSSVNRENINDILYLREFRRVDVAVVENINIKHLIEFKSGYVFDLIKKPSKTNDAIEWIRHDFNKAKNIEIANSNPGCKQSCVLITIDVLTQGVINEDVYGNFIKYCSKINSFYRRRNGVNIFEEQKKRLLSCFDNVKYDINGQYWGRGYYLGFEVDFYYWVIDKL